MTRQRNLHIYPAPIVNESRIFKETLSIACSGLFTDVVICGTARPDLPREEALTHGIRIERIGTAMDERRPNVLRRALAQISWARAVLGHYAGDKVSLVNAHSVAVLPLGYLLSRRLGARLIYDTHELETETITAAGVQRLIYKAIERLFITKCDAIFVVNSSISKWYGAKYSNLQPIVIRNVPNVDADISKIDVRKMLTIPEDKRLFIHVGNLVEERNILAILEAFACPQIDDHLLLLGDGHLKPLVQEYTENYSNIHRLPPVPSSEVPGYVAACDVGFCLTKPSCLSQRLSLPNKAFEYAKAGVPFFFTDLPEIDLLLGNNFSNWRIADPKSELIQAINSLTADVIDAASADLAKLRLPTWQEEASAMMDKYSDVLSLSDSVLECSGG